MVRQLFDIIKNTALIAANLIQDVMRVSLFCACSISDVLFLFPLILITTCTDLLMLLTVFCRLHHIRFIVIASFCRLRPSHLVFWSFVVLWTRLYFPYCTSCRTFVHHVRAISHRYLESGSPGQCQRCWVVHRCWRPLQQTWHLQLGAAEASRIVA